MLCWLCIIRTVWMAGCMCRQERPPHMMWFEGNQSSFTSFPHHHHSLSNQIQSLTPPLSCTTWDSPPFQSDALRYKSKEHVQRPSLKFNLFAGFVTLRKSLGFSISATVNRGEYPISAKNITVKMCETMLKTAWTSWIEIQLKRRSFSGKVSDTE